MICTAVPKDALDIVWADASGLLNKAIHTSKGKYHIDDIYHDLTKGLYSLWLVIDDKGDDKVIAAITTRIIEYPSKKAMALDWVGGKRMNDWLPLVLEKINSFAKDCGCEHLEGYGRKAWS